MRMLVAVAFITIAAHGCDDSGECHCEVTINGESRQLACGTLQCLGGHQQLCSTKGELAEGMVCGSTFDCDGETCDSSTQYCLTQWHRTTLLSSACTALPFQCTTCECAKQATSCSSHIACSDIGGALHVSCTATTRGQSTTSTTYEPRAGK